MIILKKKYLIIAIIILAIALIVGISLKIGTDFSKETKIKNEVKLIVEYLNKGLYNDETLTKILNREVVETGDYNLVEKSIKSYYKDLQADLSNIDFLISEDNFSNYLSGSNLKEDRPSFIKSKDNLHNTKSQITEVFTELDNQLNDKSLKMIYIADKDVKSYYKEFYLSLIDEYLDEDFYNNIKTSKENTLSKIDTYNETLDFLIANKGHWDIDKEVIIFDDNIYYEEYLSITNKLTGVS